MHATMVVHHEHKSGFASPANDVMPLYIVAGTRLQQARHGAPILATVNYIGKSFV